MIGHYLVGLFNLVSVLRLKSTLMIENNTLFSSLNLKNYNKSFVLNISARMHTHTHIESTHVKGLEYGGQQKI